MWFLTNRLQAPSENVLLANLQILGHVFHNSLWEGGGGEGKAENISVSIRETAASYQINHRVMSHEQNTCTDTIYKSVQPSLLLYLLSPI